MSNYQLRNTELQVFTKGGSTPFPWPPTKLSRRSGKRCELPVGWGGRPAFRHTTI